MTGLFLILAVGQFSHLMGAAPFWQLLFNGLAIIPAIAVVYLYQRSRFVHSTSVLEAQQDLERRKAELEAELSQCQQELAAKQQELKEVSQELQQMQLHLMQAEKMAMLGQMVSGISHEINNPINFIYGNLPYIEEHVQDLLKVIQAYQSATFSESANLQEVLEEVELDYVLEDLPSIVDSIKLGTNRIRELVLNLRNFYRRDEAEMKLADLHEGIKTTLVLLHNRYKKHNIEIVEKFGDIPPIECHINQINQVFMNLISNGIDALVDTPVKNGETSIRKQIIITTERLGSDRVAVRISDNGHGMTTEVLQHLFEPFFTTKPIGVGTGLGLSISYQIVTQSHKGKIYSCSELGMGTTFTVELPIFQPQSSNIEASNSYIETTPAN